LKEIDRLREDYAAYASGDVLLLGYDDSSAHCGAIGIGRDGSPDDGGPAGGGGTNAKKKSRVHRPRSMLFRAVVEFNPFARSSSSSGGDVGANSRRSWAKMPEMMKRKKRGNRVDDDCVVVEGEEAKAGGGYDPPTIV
jgi:hypothetical protein